MLVPYACLCHTISLNTVSLFLKIRFLGQSYQFYIQKTIVVFVQFITFVGNIIHFVDIARNAILISTN